MSPYRKTALLLIRLVAFGCMLFSLLQLGAHLIALKAGKPVDSTIVITLKSLPLVVGIVLMVKSYSIAKKLTEDFDE